MQTLQSMVSERSRTINFSGIKGEVIDSSPHGNYLVVKLSRRIAIIGTFTNQFNWQESEDNDSGFVSFIAYIGLKNIAEKHALTKVITELGGDIDQKVGMRKAKRVKAFPLEMKVRNLSPESLIKLTKIS